MTDVKVLAVDERDSNWEMSDPRFRVYLHGSGPSSTGGWTATYDITGADVLHVIDWAQRQAEDSVTYAIALVHDDRAHEQFSPGRGRGLIWLLGMDGNEVPASRRGTRTQQRMLGRRREPVGIPLADRMPQRAPSVAPEVINRLNRAQPPR